MKILSRTRSDFASDVDVWVVTSANTGQDYRVVVAGPGMPSHDTYRCPVLYGVDADVSAGAHLATCRSLLLGGEIPPLYSVSIGYPLEAPIAPILQRNRDLSPSSVPAFDAWGPRMWGGTQNVSSGGGPAFFAFMQDELKPLIETEYPVSAEGSALSGMSLGGLFAAWVLLNHRQSFQRYNIVSPALWWDEYSEMRRAEKVLPAAPPDGVVVHVSVGELESKTHMQALFATLPAERREVFEGFADAMNWPDMVQDAQAFFRILSSTPNANGRVKMRVYPAETHQSVYGASLGANLRFLFGRERQ